MPCFVELEINQSFEMVGENQPGTEHLIHGSFTISF